MFIGVPKEIKDHEFRVGLTPNVVAELIEYGHTVWVESGAGEGSGFPDEEYKRVGAYLTGAKQEMFDESELIVKVKEPLLSECAFFHPRHTLFAYLHLAAGKELTEALISSGITAIAYETTEDEKGQLPILQPMSEIAGRMSVQIGAHYLERVQGGCGVLLSGVPGVEPARVVILGAGVVGTSAAKIAVGMGAQVTVISLDLDQLRRLDDHYQGRIVTLASNKKWVEQAVEQADLVIGAVLIRGARTPQLISRSVVARMKPGAVIVDVAVDQGGCIETTRPTSHSDPVYTKEGVLHYCVTNIPGIVPRTATFALTNATLPFIVRLAEAGVDQAIISSPGLSRGVNLRQGKVTCQAVAEAHGLSFHPID